MRARGIVPRLHARGVLTLALAGICVSFPAAGTTSAAPTLVTRPAQLAGSESIAIAGPQTLIASRTDESALVSAYVAGQAPKEIVRPDDGLFNVELSASPSHVAVFGSGETPGYKGSGTPYRFVESGPLFGSLAKPTEECMLAPTLDESIDTGGEFFPSSTVAIDEEVFAHDSFGCVIAEDLASGAAHVIKLQATLDPVFAGGKQLAQLRRSALLTVAGQLLAYRANALGGEGPASVVVYDLATDGQLYSVPLPPYHGDERPPTFALEENGTLLVANAQSCSATLSTPATPTPAPLGVPACEVAGLQEGRALIVAPRNGSERALEWTTLAAPALHEIAGLGSNGLLEAATPVLSAGDVAYAIGGCWGPDVYRTSLSEPGQPTTPPATCPAHVAARARLTKRGVSFSLSCPLGCHGEYEATTRLTSSTRVASSRRGGRLGSGSFSLSPGASKTITLPQGETPPEGAYAAFRKLRRRLRAGLDAELDLSLATDTPLAEGERFGEGRADARDGETAQPVAVIPVKLARCSQTPPRRHDRRRGSRASCRRGTATKARRSG